MGKFERGVITALALWAALILLGYNANRIRNATRAKSKSPREPAQPSPKARGFEEAARQTDDS